MQKDLTTGKVTSVMLRFAVPMILGNLLQQLYNVADTLIVGKYLGAGPLAAVGSSFTLMVFLTSIILGLCMGSGIVFSMLFGGRDMERLKNSIFISFVLIGSVSLIINIAVLCLLSPLLSLLQIPADILTETEDYLRIIFFGIMFTFLYNYFAALLRSMGNSMAPLIFLAVSAMINILLDLLFVLTFHMGVGGAALATVIAQGISAAGISVYCLKRLPNIRLKRRHLQFNRELTRDIIQYSSLTCIQQSIMNFGILMIQGLVNSFGVQVMAAFAAAVKIDSFAYMPVQDFGNAFSTFIAQNFGAKKTERIRQGIRSAIGTAVIFCLFISATVFIFADKLMLIFIQPQEQEIISIGTQYLRIEGMCYCGIGCLFLLYGLYRGIGKPGISVVLTVISLGTRVLLAYILAPVPSIGLLGIWWAIPIGWFLADAAGLFYYKYNSFFTRHHS
ncbi:MATE family efflux transporter [Robinsoniella peoriensis]|uniref:Probable multidrug resistance protein NorM n=1 Tax=Robinsoniella peoriensis TaxID=180332 RepID=A0A4U8QAZ8_9FIRM|nr:MATE family efflux transporter [Robinsoniella peoriensis]TLD01433.1 Multidrug export protein MepA [Robinsoniella peoriensis]